MKITLLKKLSAVELYLSSKLSYQEVSQKEDITNPSLIVNWVNRFRIAGPNVLRPHKKGHKKTVDKTLKDTINQSIDISAENIKELEDELLKLRIENVFLKN